MAIYTAMRPLLTITFFLAAAAFAHGQEQDHKLMDRINKPNMDAHFNANKNFSAKAFNDSHAAVVKEFQYTQKFTAKDFLTGNYGSAKSFWMGDFKFASTAAETKGKHVIPHTDEPFKTKAASDTKTAKEAEKNYATREFVAKQYVKRGLSQDRFDKEGPAALGAEGPVGWAGAMQVMTIDQVRELLNKNK